MAGDLDIAGGEKAETGEEGEVVTGEETLLLTQTLNISSSSIITT